MDEHPVLDADVDVATLLALVAACTLQDVDDIQECRKGKNTAGPLSDEDFALQLFADDARVLQDLARDMALAHSIDKALRADAPVLEEFVRLEEIARGDREIARAIAEGRPPPTLIQASALLTGVTTPITTDPGSATLAYIAPRKSLESCVICRDDIRGPVIHAPCGDAYDVQCLVDLYRAVIVDESLFPPSCCRQPFNITNVRMYLSKDLVSRFEKKAIEFGTKNRVYCYRPTCSAFLGAATGSASHLHCQECWSETCGHCKKAAHSTLTRCTSAEDEDVVALAEQYGWKRCPGCGHLVELSIGCYHMTCRCRHQFCYLCTATWKTCTCTQWDENRLLLAAQDRVDRQQRLQGNAVQAPVRAANYGQVVQREVARLRENHDCLHRWRYVTGGGNCDGCGHYLHLFLFNCSDCQLWACARCRRNRWM
ncbi:hypothetical protein C8Q80DRAFT_1215891 [Daedaleopsis nitida]|nr:hypothetical protein C8Q80DRAFT_1215891 [Daedaleopsis nitida]